MTLITLHEIRDEALPLVPDSGTHVPSHRSRAKRGALAGPECPALKELLPHIDADEDYDLVTRGQWSLHQFIAHVVDIIGPCECWLTSWGISAKPLNCLLDLVRSQRITRMHPLLDHRVRLQAPDAFQLLLSMADHPAIDVRLAKVHAKVVVLMNAQHAVRILTSANLTVNPRYEAYSLSADRGKAEFHASWIGQECARASSILDHDA